MILLGFQIDSNHRPIQISFNIDNDAHLTVSVRISRSSDHHSSTIELTISDNNEQQAAAREQDQAVTTATVAAASTVLVATATQDGNGDHNDILEEDASNWDDILGNTPSSCSSDEMILGDFLTPKTASSDDSIDEDNFH